LDADAGYVWPPVLHVASLPDWRSAVIQAVRFSRLPGELQEHMAAALQDDDDWLRRRNASNVIAQELFRTGRKAVGEAWHVLGVDLTLERERNIAATFVVFAAEQADRTHDRTWTTAETLAAHGWQVISTMDGSQIESCRVKVCPSTIRSLRRIGSRR
jgi:CDP-diacylglycerol pyrophosphatase